MSYKGSDLDLRTPYALGVSEDAAGQAGWSLPPMPGRDGPIPVDQTVLACCNAAYDAALFHGARDVRVEHLLYALTRVDAARDILEQHGVRTQQLRRDAAGAIVDEAPATGAARCRAAPPNMKTCSAVPQAAPGRTACPLRCTMLCAPC